MTRKKKRVSPPLEEENLSQALREKVKKVKKIKISKEQKSA